MGLDNIFKSNDTEGNTDAYLCVVKKIEGTATTGYKVTDEALNWD